MKIAAIWALLLLFPSLSLAEPCKSGFAHEKNFDYMPGAFLPVSLGTFQFDLPARPERLASVNGLLAIYSQGRSISHQPLSKEEISGDVESIAGSKSSIGDLYKLIYGITSESHLGKAQRARLLELRTSLFGIDCKNAVEIYRINGTPVIFHETRTPRVFEILIIHDKLIDYIQVKGPKSFATEILKSIKKR